MKKRSAFSLIEISIVITVIAVLAVGVMQGQSILAKSRIAAARTQTAQSPVKDIPDLNAWFETTSERSFDAAETSNNSAVTTWYDINPNGVKGLNATQSNSTHKPLYQKNVVNNLPMLRFNSASSHYLNLPSRTIPYGNSSYSIFIVSRPNSTSYGTLIYSGTGNINEDNAVYYSGSSIVNAWNNNDASASIPKNRLHIFSFTYNNSAGRTIYINGTSRATSAAVNRSSSPFNNCIGGGSSLINMFDGHIGEIIIYNRYLRTEERKSVEKYLSRKWNITDY